MTDLHILFHGLHLTLDCEWTSDPGEAPSHDCPGADSSVEIGTIRHEGVLVERPSDELIEALEEAAMEYDGDNS